MTQLLLIRHGQTTWNIENRLQGQSDSPLCESGRNEIRSWVIPDEFIDFTWASSPLQRAVETARILGHDVEIVEELKEMSWGRWEGKNWQELQIRLGKETMKCYGANSLDFKPPDGESPRELQARLIPWLTILRVPTVAVCHKGIIQAIYSMASGWDMQDKPPVKIRTGYAYLFEIKNGYPCIVKMSIPLQQD
ncbi:MAG: histidine phosphatase family protein [Gammaproteobacteria bacterium]|nr:histidine phosphatase family protein [Gammaproteobacteria bacterium]